MGNKDRNTNYDILDKILADADRAERSSGNGRWVADPIGTGGLSCWFVSDAVNN